jgi:predicted Zn-dependent protease
MLLLAALTLLNDPVVTGYVERIGEKLGPGVAITITVDKEPRAAVFHSDGVRITTAMIAGAQNEAELAGILAHEIAHYRSRAEKAPEEDEASGLCLRFAAHEPEFPDGLGWEHGADQAAIAMLTKAGYDPSAMLKYFSTLRHSSTELPRVFSAADVLLERLELEATDHPMKDPVVDRPEFQSVRVRVK